MERESGKKVFGFFFLASLLRLFRPRLDKEPRCGRDERRRATMWPSLNSETVKFHVIYGIRCQEKHISTLLRAQEEKS